MREDESAQNQRKMDGPGVARKTRVILESDTLAEGRQCDNSNCLVVEGVGKAGQAFKRCGQCKSRWYCSAHCQRTDWQQGHKKHCKTMATEFAEAEKERQKALKELEELSLKKKETDHEDNHVDRSEVVVSPSCPSTEDKGISGGEMANKKSLTIEDDDLDELD